MVASVNFWESMRVLVTGGTGFTGAALALRLLGEGHAVVALDTKEGMRLEELRDAGADVRFGSVTHPGVVHACMEGVDVVHHVAAAFREVNAPDSHFYEVNVVGTRNVLEAAKWHRVRKFVHCSTCGVHGDVDDPPADEDAPIAPEDYYQETKYQGELAVLEAAEQGLDAVILRPNALYGPGDPGRFLLLLRQVRKGYFPMFGSGRTRYHTLYIDNFLDAFLLAMEPGRGTGRAYLVADAECPTIEELVRQAGVAMEVDVRIVHLPLAPLVAAAHVMEKLAKPFNVSPPIFPRRVEWFRHTRSFDIGRARRELGYEPRVELPDGLRRAVAWYRERGMLN